MEAKLILLYQKKIFMKANTKFQMYFELGQENFQSFNHKYRCQSVNHIQVQSRFKCDDLGMSM